MSYTKHTSRPIRNAELTKTKKGITQIVSYTKFILAKYTPINPRNRLNSNIKIMRILWLGYITDI